MWEWERPSYLNKESKTLEHRQDQEGRYASFDSCQLLWWLFLLQRYKGPRCCNKINKFVRLWHDQHLGTPRHWLMDGASVPMGCYKRSPEKTLHPQPARLDQSLEQTPPHPWYLPTLLWSHGFELRTHGWKRKRTSTSIIESQYWNLLSMMINIWWFHLVQEVLEQLWHQLRRLLFWVRTRTCRGKSSDCFPVRQSFGFFQWLVFIKACEDVSLSSSNKTSKWMILSIVISTHRHRVCFWTLFSACTMVGVCGAAFWPPGWCNRGGPNALTFTKWLAGQLPCPISPKT